MHSNAQIISHKNARIQAPDSQDKSIRPDCIMFAFDTGNVPK